MARTIKTKIAWGVAFLFALLIVTGGLSFFYLHKIITDQRNILKDNYESIGYTTNMLQALDDWKKNAEESKKKFQSALLSQQNNITEEGEDIATSKLAQHFQNYVSGQDSAQLLIVRNDINAVMQLNLEAIVKKNEQVQKNADDAKFIIAVLLSICILAAFTFIVNFPGIIANPVAKLTEGIKAIASKKYDQRIHLQRNDEFGEMAVAFNNMAEELDKYEHSNLARIMFEKQRAETVINSLKDASIGIDNKGMVLFANSQALQLLNLKEHEIVLQKQQELVTSNDLFRFLLSPDSNQPFKIVVNNKEEFYTKEITDIKNADGIMGYVLVLKNITPYKELDVAKTNFIATMSHELKTPLASSDFSLKLLQDERTGNLNDEQKELVQNLQDDNKRLLKILSELLDLSQVESGRLQLNIQEVSAAAIVQKSADAVLNAAKQKNISIQSDAENSLAFIKADEEKTSWVLINLLNNAIKYSSHNTIVQVNVRQENDMLLFAVTDQGKGIEEKYLARIFDRYFKVPGSVVYGSTGLGLAICKEFIEAQHGSIYAESIAGKGSVFYFTLPIAHKA